MTTPIQPAQAAWGLVPVKAAMTTPIQPAQAAWGLVEALLIGLIVGAQRESSRDENQAGLRDFLLIAMTGGICGLLQNTWRPVPLAERPTPWHHHGDRRRGYLLHRGAGGHSGRDRRRAAGRRGSDRGGRAAGGQTLSSQAGPGNHHGHRIQRHHLVPGDHLHHLPAPAGGGLRSLRLVFAPQGLGLRDPGLLDFLRGLLSSEISRGPEGAQSWRW